MVMRGCDKCFGQEYATACASKFGNANHNPSFRYELITYRVDVELKKKFQTPLGRIEGQ
jgi:hypothetical protein